MATDSRACIESFAHSSCLVIKILEPQMRDFEKSTQIKVEIIAAVREALPKTVIIDLGCVHFVGSVGFLAFLAIRREPTVENIILCNLDENVHKLFSVCKLIPEGSGATAPLQVADTVDMAIALYSDTANATEGK